MPLFKFGEKVSKVYWHKIVSRPPTDIEFKMMDGTLEEGYLDLYHSVIRIVIVDGNGNALYRGEASRLKKLYMAGKDKPCEEISMAIVLPQAELLGGETPFKDQSERNAWITYNTEMMAKHTFEQYIKKPVQNDRYFVFHSLGLPNSDLAIGVAIYFAD